MPELHERNGKSYTRKRIRSLHAGPGQAAAIHGAVGDRRETVNDTPAADARRGAFDPNKFRELEGSFARRENRSDQRTFGAQQSDGDVGEQAAGAIDHDMLIVATADFVEQSKSKPAAFTFACGSDAVTDESNAVKATCEQLRGEQCERSITEHRDKGVALSGNRAGQAPRSTGGESEHGVRGVEVIGNCTEL